MNLHHHNGDYAARTISPGTAFMFTRLRIGVSQEGLGFWLEQAIDFLPGDKPVF
jgi:hypothetical protein